MNQGNKEGKTSIVFSSWHRRASKTDVVSIEYDEGDIDKRLTGVRSENHVMLVSVGTHKREKQADVVEPDVVESDERAVKTVQKRRQSQGTRQSRGSLTYLEEVK